MIHYCVHKPTFKPLTLSSPVYRNYVRHIKKSARKGDRIGFVTIEFKLDGTQLVSYSFGEKHYRGMEQIAVALERAKTSLLSRYIQ